MRFLALEEKKLEEQRMQGEEQRQQKELANAAHQLYLPDLVDKCVNHVEQRITIFTCLDIR